MCDFCEKEKPIFEHNEISTCAWGWGQDVAITIAEAEADHNLVRKGVFLDRGYLRYVDLDDCQCLDHGEKIEISFCPMCGRDIRPASNNEFKATKAP